MRVLALLLALSLSGCLERGVSSSELPGIWTIAPESSAASSPQTQSSSAFLVLKGDGTFDARKLPGRMWRLENREITGTGSWTFSEEDRFVKLVLLAVTDGDGPSVPNGTQLYTSAKQRSGPKLHYFIGDPDDWNTIDFEQREADR